VINLKNHLVANPSATITTHEMIALKYFESNLLGYCNPGHAHPLALSKKVRPHPLSVTKPMVRAGNLVICVIGFV
jgi:hypothetical protein